MTATTFYLGAKELVKGVRTSGSWTWTDISTRHKHGHSIHPDQHTMAFDPRIPDVLYAGNDGGIFRSPDAGASWQSLNAGLAISEVEYLTQRPDEPTGCWPDCRTTARSAASARLWTQVALGDGGDCGTDMADPDICYHSYYHMYLERSTIAATATSGSPSLRPRPGPVHSCSIHRWRSTARSWSRRAVHLRVAGQRSRHRSRSPSRGHRSLRRLGTRDPRPGPVLVGTIQGDVFRIPPPAGDRQPHPAGPAEGRLDQRPARRPQNSSRYWVTFSNPGAVFRSDDQGAHWTDVTANLPAIPVNAIVTDPGTGARLGGL